MEQIGENGVFKMRLHLDRVAFHSHYNGKGYLFIPSDYRPRPFVVRKLIVTFDPGSN